MIDANAIVETLLESDLPDPKDFVAQTFEPSFGFSREDQNAAAHSAARCIYLWLMQDFDNYFTVDDFTHDLAHSVADIVTDDLKIGYTFRADDAIAAEALGKVFAGKAMTEIVTTPKPAWDLSKEAAQAAVDAFVNKSPDKTSYKLRRLRHRRGEM
jgi:hypothetical protein